MSMVWMELFVLIGVELIPNTSYQTQMDGQIKIANEWMEGRIPTQFSFWEVERSF